jgi:hypothetical protein
MGLSRTAHAHQARGRPPHVKSAPPFGPKRLPVRKLVLMATADNYGRYWIDGLFHDRRTRFKF